jgi:predicted MFS family arabinose efflux permease
VLTSNYSSGVLGFRRIASLEVPALCIGNALGSCGIGAQPVWVAAFVTGGLLTPSEVGWLGSGELLLIAIGTLVVSAGGQRVSPRVIAVVAASVVAIANAVAMFPAVQTVVLGRLLSGLAMGALTASVTGVAARKLGAQRVLALIQAAVVLTISIVYFMSPILVGRYGPAGLFALIAGIGVVTAASAFFGLPDLSTEATPTTRIAGTPRLAPMLGCLALASIFVGVNTVFTYIVTIGTELGFGARTMGNVLAAVGPLAMLGPIAAHILGERAGLLRPLLLGLVVVAVDFFFLVSAGSPVLLCIYAAALNMALMFCVPYTIALIGRVDPSGRFPSAAPAFMMIGGAVGPKLGSELIGFAHFQALAAVAASCVAVGILLFVALGSAFPRRQA